MRRLLDGVAGRAREPDPPRIQDPYPFRALPQVDGAVHDALAALEETVSHELNFAGENALIVPGEDVALPNGNPHAAPLANAIDALRTAIAQSVALIAARVSTLLDTSLTGLPPFLARRPGPESGALVLEYTAHAAAIASGNGKRCPRAMTRTMFSASSPSPRSLRSERMSW